MLDNIFLVKLYKDSTQGMIFVKVPSNIFDESISQLFLHSNASFFTIGHELEFSFPPALTFSMQILPPEMQFSHYAYDKEYTYCTM